MKKLINNESGFTLLEITIAAGLLGFLAMAFLKYQQNQMKSTKTNINKTEINNYIQGMKAYMGKPGICKKSLQELGTLKNEQAVSKILRPDGEVKYAVNEKVTGTNYNVSAMYISDVFINKVKDQTLHRGEAAFNIELTRMDNRSFGGKVLKKSFDIDMYVDNSGAISDCSVLGGLYLPLGPSTQSGGTDETSEASTESENTDLNKTFERTVKEASQKTGQHISQEDIKKAVKSNPQLQQAMESLKVLQESNKKMEELMNEEF